MSVLNFDEAASQIVLNNDAVFPPPPPLSSLEYNTTSTTAGTVPPFRLGYLEATRDTYQPLCGNVEGWGPLSPFRYDFTPCFLDVWIASVAVFGIAFGAAALWWLLKRQKPQPVTRNWHFFAKLTVIGLLIIATALQASLQIEYYPHVWMRDFRFWSSVLALASMAVIFVVQYFEHWRSRNPNGVVLFYWLGLLIVYAVKLRSLISQQVYDTHLPYFVTFCVSLGLAALELILEWLVPKKQSAYNAVGDDEECPIEYANVFSILTFSWMTPMMKYGYREYLTEDDLWNLRKRDSTKASSDSFAEAWAIETEKKKPSLWLALFRGFSGPYFRGAIFKTGSDVLAFVQPQLLRLLISFVDSYRGEPQPVIRGAAIALAMFAVSVSQTIFLHQYFQRAFETGMRVKASLTANIYQKSMRLSNEGRAAKSTGDIVNYMAVDTQRLQDLTQYGQMLWSAPLQIVLCMLSLYQLVGYSMFAGVGAMILMIPVNGLIAKLMKTLQKQQMKNKDARTRLMTEILNNMKSIKLYAWTAAFMDKLNYIRNEQELKTLRKIGATQAIANFTWSTTPFLVSCSTFMVFVLTQDRPLTTELVFPALTLFNLLTFPLAVLPMVITSIIEASVAVGRLTSFFEAEELQTNAVIYKDAATEEGEETIRIRDASFTWNKEEPRRALDNINFSAKKGELSCIVGRVGMGKSSFLQALLGDLWKINGEVVVHGKTAYVAQQAWVMNATVRENVIFGHRWDPKFYDLTVRACALTDDFQSLPDGDQTEVGERGISLSGGQKARLTLARAVYARADIYLLDDVLSAVDQHVGRHLINNVLGPQGLLAGKTRVLATNSIPVLSNSSLILLIRDGKIIEKGTYDQMMAMKGEIYTLIRTSNNQEDDDDSDSSERQGGSSQSEDSSTMNGGGSEDVLDLDETDEIQEGMTQLAPINPGSGKGKMHRSSTTTLRRASTASFRGPRGKVTDEEGGAGSKSKQGKEFSEQGKVKWNVYAEYAKTSNIIAVAIYLLTLVGAQTAQVGGSVWLKRWSEANSKTGRNPEVGKYIGIYFAFGFGGAALVVLQTLILWIFCSIEASRKLHERMAFAIFRSPMSFFETTPAGRILNRFSRVDEVLSRVFNMLFVNAARASFTLVIVSVGTPVFVALIIPLGLIYLYIQKYYLRASRELKRLDSVTRSPIYAHFQESLGGMTTIRAYRQQERFALENEWRVDANLRAYFPSISANRWLAVRLEFIGSVIILAAAALAITAVATGSPLSAGMVGLSMSYVLQITQSLNWIVRQTVEVETNIVSVERVLEYARLPSEAPEVLSKKRPNISWPAQGAVKFNHYSTRYRPGLDLVLKDVNLDIKGHEKIGVVGRTGAGKSSLTLALFRIIEPAEGNIDIDNLNTSSIGLLDLRRRLAIIPQDAALFEGTIRENLDPGRVHDDTELWSVLDHARLKDYVASLNGRLDAQVHEGGSNLSQGQRQLVSLARALLTPSSILVLDEATAAVDIQTDALLQATLRSSIFNHRTIITIAHRINTILDSDRVVVLDHGKVAEFDTPAELVRQKGLFYDLVKEAGLLDSMGPDGVIVRDKSK
ncbi:MAG: exo-1,3-beta-glucanase [Chaenotheca gracillima]|nr:MAG: exo-1,3-beta-glucanase [Chaenotheca gracillima]